MKLGLGVMLVMLCSCVSSEQHVVGKGSSISDIAGTMAYDIHSRYSVKGRNIQIGPNNFWEGTTQLNLPFSSVLSDTLSAKFSELGANITLQETGENPLRLMGTYKAAGNDVLVTVKLRTMGDASSTDLVVVQERISKKDMDASWLDPQFSRMARTLVRMLEDNYAHFTNMKVAVKDFTPGISSQPELGLGSAMAKYLDSALGSSAIFQSSGNTVSEAVLKGEYSLMDGKMVFHAMIATSKDSRTVASATFQVPKEQIPRELMQSQIQSLDDLVGKVAARILESYSKLSADEKGSSRVCVSRKNFVDMSSKSISPLSMLLADKFATAFSQGRQLNVVSEMDRNIDWVCAAQIYSDTSGVTVRVSFDRKIKNRDRISFETVIAKEERLNAPYCRLDWFENRLNHRTDFLMHQLEKKSAARLASDAPVEIVINRFKYQNSQHYSKFSDYLEGYMLDYFADSMYFAPVKNIEQRLTKIKTRGIRSIVPTKKTEATVAALANAQYYIEGSFWPAANGSVEIKATLLTVQGKILASDHIIVSRGQFDPTWLEIPAPQHYSQNIDLLSNQGGHLSFELLTQKGRNNLSFGLGEEILFFIKANKNVYIKLYSIDAQNSIYRIYPNEFTASAPLARAGRVTAIPDNSYSSDFSFQVKGETGNEMVFAFASDTPLPDLPGSSDTGFHGMRQVNMNIRQIKQWFSDYALKRGISLSWDSLPIRTHR